MSTNLGQLAAGVRGVGGLAGLASGANPGGYGGALSTLGSAAGSAGNGLGVLSGLQQGGIGGYGSAGVNAAQLANKAGAFGNNNSTVNGGIGDAANALGIYSGIKAGGVGGYGGAAINAGQLGLNAGVQSGAMSAATAAPYSSALSYAAIPLDIYNEVNNWKSGATTSDAMAGATTGAAIGSVVPVVGTAFGALIGGAAGALSSLAGPGRTDPETEGVQQLINATGQYGNTQQIAQSVTNPYLELAGLMDERSSTLPEYQQYGRMGEQKFTQDLASQLNSAINSGEISKNTDPTTAYSTVIAPWVNSMNKNGSTVGNTYDAVNQGLLENLTSEYLSGNAANDWKAIGGDSPFQGIYQNSPIQGATNLSTLGNTTVNPEVSRSGSKMARGGSMKKKADGGRAKRKSVLDSIRPSFGKERKTNYDDGGYVGYFNPMSDLNLGLNDFQPQLQDPTQSPDVWNQSDLDQYLNSSTGEGNVGGLGTSAGSSSGGGGLAGLAKSAAPYAALLPLLGAAANKLGGSGSSSASTPAGQSAAPTGPFQSQASPRTANPIDPNTDWYTYGQHPETQFFSNNSIGPLMGQFAAPQASQPTPTTGAGASPAMPSQPPNAATSQPLPADMPRPMLKSQGGALDSLEGEAPGPGQSRHVKGAGDGTSDDIDAKLSDGEYVIDANTVSMLGNGSNKAGADRLDQMRENLRRHAAKPMVKGKQFMKAKAPEAYMKGGKKKPLAFNVEGEG